MAGEQTTKLLKYGGQTYLIDVFRGGSTGLVSLAVGTPMPTADDSAELAYPGDGIYTILLENRDEILWLNMGESGSVTAITSADGAGARSGFRDGDTVVFEKGTLADPKLIGRMSTTATKVWLRRVGF